MPMTNAPGLIQEYPSLRGPGQPVPEYDGGDLPDAGQSPYRQGPISRDPGPALRPVPPEIPNDDDLDAGSPSARRPARSAFSQKIADLWHRSIPNKKNRSGAAPAQTSADGTTSDQRSRESNRGLNSGTALSSRGRRELPVTDKNAASRAQLVTLAAPQESYESVAQLPRPRSLPMDSRPLAALSDSQPQRANMLHSAEIASGYEPVPVVDPPLLRAPPVGATAEPGSTEQKRLSIPRILVCRQVNGFDDVAPFDPRKLRQGQPILIYAALENFRSIATSKGYRTLTLSTLEVRTPEGDLLQRQPLGTAVDLVDVPRHDFFLTHLITIPEDLPPGDYVFSLFVDDLLGHESARAQIAARVMEDHNPRDETADTSRFATRPASSPK